MKKCYVYNIDVKTEYKIYKKVGKYRGNCIRSRKKGIPSKYSEWADRIESKLPLNIQNYEDFIHFLSENKYSEIISLESIKNIVIPLYIALPVGVTTIFSSFTEGNDKMGIFFVAIVVVTFFSTIIYHKQSMKVQFWEDFIEVAKKKQQ